jgi:hypothetical protein
MNGQTYTDACANTGAICLLTFGHMHPDKYIELEAFVKVPSSSRNRNAVAAVIAQVETA